MAASVVKLSHIDFRYYGSEVNSLTDVSLEIKEGEWVAIIGPNGSGKSTLAKIMNGLLVPAAGQVTIKDLTIDEETVWEARRSVGMVFQNPDNQFVGSTVEDDVAFGLENNGVPRQEMISRIEEALAEVRMSEFKDKEPARLSGGQKQRVALASILALRPDIIILDEATSMLDPNGRQEVIAAIRKIKERFNLTVISITHDLDEASLADRILMMQGGRLVQDKKPEEIFLMGEQLVEQGLDVPFSQKLKDALAARGLDVPDNYLDEEALLTWITPLYSTK
ncbi:MULTISPECIES: energy-coupling factor ABC transporter ATP-binding protein [Abiotrophia]|jgi:cobalt import ATP-binding protein cbiO 1|uniref:Energy-coupling factor ABC transporter ATP-binding protein n=1 Tax=Abiotrophia defectiva TaxID=46125 RepID=A0A929QUA9_ABIDE|nr:MULTISPECIES: energy-coupling factor ABC transporter ATP-binding protein [Abiotrophia]MBF0935675.1 energy-coupling factor ABC transporter ATP-binding protein [Abiotrophia defectiva]OFS28837.1 energy-coupling factor transporter ATPase [Abiotrophia sp. HMSC24B09]